MRVAGKTPKLITSHRESSSLPNAELVFSNLATIPSKKSHKSAIAKKYGTKLILLFNIAIILMTPKVHYIVL